MDAIFFVVIVIFVVDTVVVCTVVIIVVLLFLQARTHTNKWANNRSFENDDRTLCACTQNMTGKHEI